MDKGVRNRSPGRRRNPRSAFSSVSDAFPTLRFHVSLPDKPSFSLPFRNVKKITWENRAWRREERQEGFGNRVLKGKISDDFVNKQRFEREREMYFNQMRRSFKDSLKVLEADIQHANTLLCSDHEVPVLMAMCDRFKQATFLDFLLQARYPHNAEASAALQTQTKCDGLSEGVGDRRRASDFPREYDGACLQMRMSYSSAAHLFLFLVQWTDCRLAGFLGLVHVDGTTTMSVHERKASIGEFYAVIFPSLLQLSSGITDMEDKKQKAVCMERYRRRDDEDRRQYSEADVEREEECGICMENNSKIVLPNCSHAMCMKCYREWRTRSQSCPFCRDSLKRVNSGDLWIYTDCREIVDTATLTRENLRRLFMYIDKLPVVIPDAVFESYDAHVK
ncbi:hypothetical protein ACLOJK_024554 [Asimina triloba]